MDENEVLQHATLTVRVAVPVQSNTPDEIRERRILDVFATGDYELMGAVVNEMDLTENAKEAGERRCAEAEARAEAKAQARYERHLDNRGRRY